MTRIWVCCSIVSWWTSHRWAHSWNQESHTHKKNKYKNTPQICQKLLCKPWIAILSRSWALMKILTAAMSGTKFNIRLHSVFLAATMVPLLFLVTDVQNSTGNRNSTKGNEKNKSASACEGCRRMGENNKIPIAPATIIIFFKYMMIMHHLL